jgi:hypothetical protein
MSSPATALPNSGGRAAQMRRISSAVRPGRFAPYPPNMIIHRSSSIAQSAAGATSGGIRPSAHIETAASTGGAGSERRK